MRLRNLPLPAAALALILLAAPARAGIEVARDYPVQGEPVTVTVMGDIEMAVAGARVFAVYRPASRVSHEEEIGLTDREGRVTWTPTDAGVVTLRAEPPVTDLDPEPAAMSRNLSVKYRGVPAPGLAVMILAALVLYGGIIQGFRMLRSPLPPELPPDT